jgi:serine/threonine protein kinase
MPKCPHCEQEHDDILHFCPVTGKPIELGERMVGKTVLEHYRVTDILGGSSIGGVFKAVDERTDEVVTLKMLHPVLGRNEELTAPYLADVQKAAGMDVDTLGTIISVEQDVSGAPVIVRTFLDGPTLADVIEKYPEGLPPGDAVYILHGILRALQATHEQDLFNADLTPRDVFIVEGASGEAIPKLAEIGERHIKSALPPEEADKPENRPYRAPEQVREDKEDASTDIFSAGVFFYQMLTGQLPYPEGIPPRPEKIPGFKDPSEIRPEVPKPFDFTIRRALALFPTDRFKTGGLFADAVKSSLPAEPVPFADLISGARAGKPETEETGAPGVVPVPPDEKKAPEPEKKAKEPEKKPEPGKKPAEEPIVPAAPAKAPSVKPKGKQEHSEESLAPIMPSRFAKWFIIAGVVVGLVVIVVLGRTIYLAATGGYEKNDLEALVTEGPKKDGDTKKDDEEQEEEEEEVAAQPDPVKDADVSTDAPAEVADAQDVQDAPAEPGPAGAETVTVKLDVEPGDAQVILDGKPSSPPHEWTLPRDEASHSYSVSAEGYETMEFKFVADKDRTLEATLEKKPVVKITLAGVPKGAAVTLDGKSVSSPYTWSFEPSKQPHSYKISAKGYEDCEGAFVPDKTRSVSCKLEKVAVEPPPTKVTPPEKKPEKKPTKKPGKKPTKKPGKKKDPGGGFVDEVPF